MSDKRQVLRDSCDQVVNYSYLKKFTPEEVLEYKNQISEVLIRINSIEDELAKTKSDYKSKLDPLKKEIKELLTFIRDKARIVEEECYINYENGFSVYYNGDGEEVYKRPQLASEKQGTIFQMKREGTNN